MLIRVNWHVSIGLAGCDQEGFFIMTDTGNADEIEEATKDEAFNCIDWGYDIEKMEVFEFTDGDPMSQEGTETNVIKLRYLKDGEPQGKAYTYYTPVKVAVGDKVELGAFKAGIAQGVVTEINVPQEEIGVFKDKAKSIIGKASLKGGEE